MYVGIDVHKSSCYITALDGKGEILTEGEMTKKKLLKWASSLSVKDELAVEASTTSRNIYQKMKEMGLNVSVAHPTKIKLIGKSSKKMDRNDSFHLANLLRMDYLPLSYVPERRYKEMRTICRYRASLGRRIARVKNSVHSLLLRNDTEIDRSDWFGVGGLKRLRSLKLNEMDSFILNSQLDELTHLMDRAREVQDVMANHAKDIPEVKLLMTIPGIDFYSAMTIIGEIGDVTRFSNPKKLVSYAGLAPRLRESGNISRSGHISKEGSRTLRWILISCAHSMLRHRGNSKLKKFYLHLIRRRKHKSVAIVAMAKKLLQLIYHLLLNDEPYEEEDKLLTRRKLDKMESRAKLPKVEIERTIDRLSEKVYSSGGHTAV